MKALKYIFLSTLLLTASSCGDNWLDLDPSTSVETNQSLSKLKDFEFTLNGIYSSMQDAYSYSGRMTYYGDVTGDDIQAYSATKRTGSYYLFKYNKDNAPSTFWRTSYAIIRNCNIILTKIDEVKTEDTAYRDDLKGQALALRALAMFDLTRLYGYPYLKDNGASWGPAIIKTVSEIDSKPARNTVAECYAEIISDLTSSVGLLSGKFNKGKINRWGAMTLLSRVYLYKGDHVNALRVAEEGISGAESSNYALWSTEAYPTAWSNDFNAAAPGEVLFEIVNLSVDSPGKESMGYLCSSTGYKDMILTSSFVKLMLEDPADVRNKAYKIVSKRAYVNKYQPQQNENDADANIPILRLSELYLNAAEAAVKSEDNNKAVHYLDAIVRRANPENTVVGSEVTLERVLTERRKELFGEGHRLYDAMRNNLRIERIDEKVSVVSSTKHLSMSDDCKSFDWNYYKIILPIPKFEMDTNPNMREQQNPGY
ncbi:MAG: RagB/SusD family nutrient uptake outer membrane protein [Bacteroidales bacterium]